VVVAFYSLTNIREKRPSFEADRVSVLLPAFTENARFMTGLKNLAPLKPE
jgi:hypothetical protein